MTETISPPLQLPTSTFKTFKFHLKHEQFVSKFLNPTLLKRNYKYIHGFETFANKEELKTIQKLKYITSLHATSWGPPDLPFFKKLLKPFRKYLKTIQSTLQNPALQKLLPQLAELNVTLDHSSWRLLTTKFTFKKLTFDFDSKWKPDNQSSHQKTVQDLLQKFKPALSRDLPRMKDLSSLEIKVMGLNTELVILILEAFGEKIMSLKFLKEFTLKLGTGTLKGKPWNPVGNPGNIFQFLTNLSISGAEGSPLLWFSAEGFKNLNNLHLTFSPAKDTEDLTQLAHLKNLPKLQKLTFSFAARSFFTEIKFFENFSLPPTLEFLDLKLENFTWNEKSLTNENRKKIQEKFENDPLYTQFFNRLLQNCGQNLKVLNLKIIQGSHCKNCPELTGKFASLLIQQFTKLETLSYQNKITKKPTDILVKPLDLGDFWKALEPSKETLASILIDAPEIILPEMINSLPVALFIFLNSAKMA